MHTYIYTHIYTNTHIYIYKYTHIYLGLLYSQDSFAQIHRRACRYHSHPQMSIFSVTCREIDTQSCMCISPSLANERLTLTHVWIDRYADMHAYRVAKTHRMP